ncbi:MAG: RnfABCDGE type electron transport complex subunit B [Firmicutes bacterium]|nr:RnfABCDGE type electron transport complex subunit B [Bacillota bacterium]
MSFLDLLAPILGLGGLGLFFGIVLVVANIVFSVEQDSRVEDILEVLPGVNCGACGYPGCSAFAEAVASGEAPVNGCPVGRQKVADEISRIMNVSVGHEDERYVAKLACRGTDEVAKTKMVYYGIQDCRAAARIDGGDKACPYGCLGLGSCIEVCPFDAISTGQDGLPVFDELKCTGCNRCKSICPKDVIRMEPSGAYVDIACNSRDKGKAVLQVCKVGCIACSKCVKTCPVDAISMRDNLAVIDHHECTNCEACIDACPTNSIVRV